MVEMLSRRSWVYRELKRPLFVFRVNKLIECLNKSLRAFRQRAPPGGAGRCSESKSCNVLHHNVGNLLKALPYRSCARVEKGVRDLLPEDF